MSSGIRILNLTQHQATAEQVAAGVVELENKAEVQALLTFDELPCAATLRLRADSLADVCEREGGRALDGIMIGGAPYFMSVLEYALEHRGMRPLYSFSRREASEETQPDGSVRKTQVFRHVGWVGASS